MDEEDKDNLQSHISNSQKEPSMFDQYHNNKLDKTDLKNEDIF